MARCDLQSMQLFTNFSPFFSIMIDVKIYSQKRAAIVQRTLLKVW